MILPIKHTHKYMRQYTEKINIFLADDDPDDRALFEQALDGFSTKHTLNFFHNGKDLLEYFNNPDAEIPDILFLDLNMPYFSGTECLIELRKNSRFRDLPIAIYSTSSSEKDQEDTFVNGANVYIKKPDSFGKLQQVLHEVITVNWQFKTSSSMNRDMFFISL